MAAMNETGEGVVACPYCFEQYTEQSFPVVAPQCGHVCCRDCATARDIRVCPTCSANNGINSNQWPKVYSMMRLVNAYIGLLENRRRERNERREVVSDDEEMEMQRVRGEEEREAPNEQDLIDGDPMVGNIVNAVANNDVIPCATCTVPVAKDLIRACTYAYCIRDNRNVFLCKPCSMLPPHKRHRKLGYDNFLAQRALKDGAKEAALNVRYLQRDHHHNPPVILGLLIPWREILDTFERFSYRDRGKRKIRDMEREAVILRAEKTRVFDSFNLAFNGSPAEVQDYEDTMRMSTEVMTAMQDRLGLAPYRPFRVFHNGGQVDGAGIVPSSSSSDEDVMFERRFRDIRVEYD